MELNLNHVIEQVAKDKGIDREALQETLEQAILQAAKKVFGAEREIEAQYNVDEGVVELFQIIRVTDEIADPFNELTLEEAEEHGLDAELGDELLFQIFYLPKDEKKAREQDERYGDILQLRAQRGAFGRIAAQTAKQVITQRIREAERDNVFSEYIDRKGELITGIVRRFERGNIIVDLGRAEAILPVREQVPRETYRPGDRVQAYVLDVQRNVKGPQIVLSRTSPGLLIKLFEMEVPEIYEGIVRIETAAREPGSRAKIAVSSRDPDVDPVGACVGMKGSRVQAVVQELRGEKIDIVPYSEDPARFVCNAIQPAEVSRVFIDEDTFTMELIVPDDQLSQAIGRRGQNVRLASQLTGWKIDIHSESKILELEEEARLALMALDGVTEEHVDTLWRLGYRSLEHIAQTEEEELANIPGITGADAERIRAGAEDLLARKEAGEDIRPSAPLPEGYDPEIEWNRWPMDVEALGRGVFDRCVRAGRFTLEDIAAEESPEAFAKTTGLDIERAVQTIYAAREALAALRAAAAEAVPGAQLTGGAPSEADEAATPAETDASEAATPSEGGSEVGG
ncbi:MAG: transcription termination/antitermination protein NusA [Myxococcales bacterium]|nr:transcription termination/antitermination protein NusA [Myxococcales bacterium]